MSTNPSYPYLDGHELSQAARHILGHYNKPGGYKAGSFTTALITAWERADSTNSYKLATAYPELGVVIHLMKNGDEVSILSLAEWTP